MPKYASMPTIPICIPRLALAGHAHIDVSTGTLPAYTSYKAAPFRGSSHLPAHTNLAIPQFLDPVSAAPDDYATNGLDI
jgi:hypothetical protein